MTETFLNLFTFDSDGELIAAFGGSMAEFFNLAMGGVDTQLQILLYLMIIDFITGMIAGAKSEGYCSRTCSDGVMRKFLIILIVSMSHVLGIVFEMSMLRHMAIVAFVINEAGSIVENIEILGFGNVIPPFLRKVLKVARDREENKIGKM